MAGRGILNSMNDRPHDTPHVTLSTAVTLTGLSKRTLWRRIADGLLRKMASGRPEEESRLVVADLLQLGKLELSPSEQDNLLRADRGEPSAQLALALFFLQRQRPEAAVQWLTKAAQQNQADAMHWLGTLYAEGSGVERDERQASEWIRKAAAQHHPIAQAQMAALFPGTQ